MAGGGISVDPHAAQCGSGSVQVTGHRKGLRASSAAWGAGPHSIQELFVHYVLHSTAEERLGRAGRGAIYEIQ